MIKISKTYHIALTEAQSMQLYQLLLDSKDIGNLKSDGRFFELQPLYDDLKRLFATGIR